MMFLGTVFTGLLADQLSKALVFEAFGGGWNSAAVQPGPTAGGGAAVKTASFSLWPNVLYLTPSSNSGGAFSFLRDRPGVILAFTAAAAVLLLVLYFLHGRREKRATVSWAYALLLIGAAGNLMDRVWFGVVRDFLDFRPRIPLFGHWPIFNIADICICVGAGLYLWVELHTPPPATTTAAKREPRESGEGKDKESVAPPVSPAPRKAQCLRKGDGPE